MADNKKSFVLYTDSKDTFEELSDQEAGKLIKHIFRYVNNEYSKELNKKLASLSVAIIAGIESEWRKYNPKTNRYHWNYKGGISSENHLIRNSQQADYWRRKVFERDKYTCQECGTIGGVLNAHHIKAFAKFPDLRFDIANGVTLCKSCHTNIHRKKQICLIES